MIGQKHYAVTRELEDGRTQYWRSRGNQWQPSGWTYDMALARRYRTPGDARSAATQLASEAGDCLEVVEVQTVLSRVVYRVQTHAMLEVPDSLCE